MHAISTVMHTQASYLQQSVTQVTPVKPFKQIADSSIIHGAHDFGLDNNQVETENGKQNWGS